MLFLGIDFGTSGARGIIINENEEVITQVKIIAFDGGNVFTADYNLSEVEQLIDNCQP